MKKTTFILLVNFLFIQCFFSQTTTNVNDLISTESFNFHAEKVIASGKRQYMTVTNSISTVSTSINLVENERFGISLKNKNLVVNLPDYQNQIDQSQGSIYSFSFSSKDYKIKKSKLRDGQWNIKINPLHTSRTRNGVVREILINVSQNGKSTTTIYLDNNSNNSRVFEGYLSDNGDEVQAMMSSL